MKCIYEISQSMRQVHIPATFSYHQGQQFSGAICILIISLRSL